MPPRSRRSPVLAALFALSALAGFDAGATPVLPPGPSGELSWSWAPFDLARDIRVAPLVLVGPVPALAPRGYLGEPLDGPAAALRAARAAQVSAVPAAFSEALPGELAGALPAGWNGHLSDARVAPAARSQVLAGLDGRRPLEVALRSAADRLPGDVVLFHWMSGILAQPAASVAAPGTTLRAADRLIYVDQHTDPVLAEATVGLALVSTDGEVFLRYEDRYAFVITGSNTAQRAGRELARRLVRDLAPLLEGDSVAALRP